MPKDALVNEIKKQIEAEDCSIRRKILECVVSMVEASSLECHILNFIEVRDGLG
jgi:hypothetical protein